MSNQIILAIDKAVSYTKDCLGATDAQLGNVKPDNTSALMVLQSNAEVPLENVRAGLYEWLEDVGAILLDMMGTYYGVRPVVREYFVEEPATDENGAPVVDEESGMVRTNRVTRRVAEPYDFSQFKKLWFNVRVNTGATTYYSEIAMVQTLDNLRRDGTLEIVDYLERIPDKLIPRKAELIQTLKKRAGTEKTEGKESLPTQKSTQEYLVGGPISEDKAVAKLPAGIQAKYTSMPAAAKRALRQIGSMSE